MAAVESDDEVLIYMDLDGELQGIAASALEEQNLKKGVVDNGCPANGDDMVFETKHRQNKRLGPLVWQGGKPASEHSVVYGVKYFGYPRYAASP